MCVKLNSLFDRDMKVYYVTQVLQESINIKMMCPNYILILETQNRFLFVLASLSILSQNENVTLLSLLQIANTILN